MHTLRYRLLGAPRINQAMNTMKLQPLEGLGVGDEDSRPTVAISLAGRAGLPVLMIAGGHGGRGAARGETDGEIQKELELMALPRSAAQEQDDPQVCFRFDECGVG